MVQPSYACLGWWPQYILSAQMPAVPIELFHTLRRAGCQGESLGRRWASGLRGYERLNQSTRDWDTLVLRKIRPYWPYTNMQEFSQAHHQPSLPLTDRLEPYWQSCGLSQTIVFTGL